MPLQWWTLSCVGVWKAVNRGSTSGQRLRASHTTETHICPHTFGSEAKLLKGDFVKNHQRNTCQVHRKEEVPLHGWVGNEVFLFSSSLHLCSSVTEFNYTPYAEAAPSVWFTAVAARTQRYIYINPALRATVLHICPEHVLAQSRASLAPGLSCKMWLNEQRPRWAA